MGCPSASETQTEACDAPACWTDSEIGPNAPFPVEVPAHRPGPSLASNPRMADRLALSKALWRSPSLVMPRHAGQNTLNGLHARDSVAKLEINQGAGAAFSPRLVACHAPRRPQRHKHRIVTPS